MKCRTRFVCPEKKTSPQVLIILMLETSPDPNKTLTENEGGNCTLQCISKGFSHDAMTASQAFLFILVFHFAWHVSLQKEHLPAESKRNHEKEYKNPVMLQKNDIQMRENVVGCKS